MIRLPGIAFTLDTPASDYPAAAARLLGIAPGAITACRPVRRAVDARRRDQVHLVLTLDVAVTGDERALLQRCKHPGTAYIEESAPAPLPRVVNPPARRPVVVGAGPAGLFAALTLAEMGLCPLLLEQGRDAESRRRDVDRFFREGVLNPASNVQFGEGGAGTFSDGKLNTGIKSPHARRVLDAFVRCGAPPAIAYEARPHIGTDHLVRVVQNLRREIIALGGEVRFETPVTGLEIESGAVRGLHAGDQMIETEAVVLAIGHSARDTFKMLQEAGVLMQAKPFSIGARIEHRQDWLNRAQYGRFAGHPALGAAEYRLATHLPNGRGVYTFCMCPGGTVVAAASEPGGVATNGMSLYARDGENANSALLVDVRPEDFPSDDPLAGVAFQRLWERRAFDLAGGDYRAPAQQVGDFLAGRASRALDAVRPSYCPGVVPADLRACLPDFVTASMAEGIRRFGAQLRGFDDPGAVLTGVETRSSSPVRIPRDATGQANLRGLYPAGEGAGYAGGILSAATDGVKVALWVAQ
ncbi:MAG: hypothetical protein LBN04_06375 [Oscillospiraceae bacterium]|jgi:uncharacterized FAD-dependent dehydrogenase|nr:hypothetical protein [Oscillospiraceae bacterium]